MRKKLSRSEGLTLVEMLAAVVILVLLGLILNAGLHMALNSYRTMCAQSETELLLSTLLNTLADDLRYASDVEPVGDVVRYTSDSYGLETELTLQDGQLRANGKRVLPDGAYGKGRYIIDTLTVEFAAPAFNIEIRVKEKEGDISAAGELTVRCLNPVEEKEEGP